MKILVLSDSHSRSDLLKRIVDLNRDCDAVIHLGDGYADLKYASLPDVPVYAVKGNGEDWFTPFHDAVPLERFLDFDGVKILMTHGHRLRVKSGFDYAAIYAAQKGADILLFGHTHIPLEAYIGEGENVGYETVIEKPLRVFNPGSVGRPMDGKPSFGLIELRGRNILLSHGTLDL